MSATNDDFEFLKPDIWSPDVRMTSFAADLKSQDWADVLHSDLKVLKLNHLFYDDDVDESILNLVTGCDRPQNWIFLRPDAKKIWDDMYERLQGQGPPEKPMAFFMVSGNSGIGKSYSMIYLLKLFLDAKKVVFYDLRRQGKLYAFIPPKGDGNYTVFRTQVSNFNGYTQERLLKKYPGPVLPPVLWDPAEEDDQNFQASYLNSHRTLVAVSIKEELVKNAYKFFDTDKRYMTQWSLEHLETVRRHCFPIFSSKQLRYRYFRYGGIFRLMFEEAEVLEEFSEKIEESIQRLSQEELESILRGYIRGKFKLISSGVFEVKPDPHNPRLKCFDIGSPYVYALLAGKFWTTMAALGKGENPRYTEWFEAMAMLRLAEGGKFKIKKLGQDSASWEELVLDRVPIKTVEPTNEKEIDNEAFYSAWPDSHEGDAMLAPSWTSLPVADCGDKSKRGFNMTVSKTHPIAYEECKKIMQVHDAATGTNDNLKLYFVVPDWIADDFKKQSFQNIKDKKNLIADRVDQYVLQIESEQIERLKDMFLRVEETIEEGFINRVEKADGVRKRKRLKTDSSMSTMDAED